MLKVNDLKINDGERAILTVPYLHLPARTSALIVGANVEGRSLLLRTIHGEYRQLEGNILIKDESIHSRKIKRKTILVQPEVHLLAKKTIRENLCIPMHKLTQRQIERAEQLGDILGLREYLDSPVIRLTYSQKIMVEIIRAVIQLPFAILIDDIDVYFDSRRYEKVLETLKVAMESGTAVLATAKCKLDGFDRYYRIDQGMVVEDES